MSDIAARARAAHNAEEEAKRLEEEAKRIREQEAAERAIHQLARQLGVDDLVDGQPVVRTNRFSRDHEVVVDLTDDASLRIKSRVVNNGADIVDVTAQVLPCDQLYWNLPPGEETKGRGGGTYGCFGLSNLKETDVKTLADIGAQLERIENARESWRRKWCQEDVAEHPHDYGDYSDVQ